MLDENMLWMAAAVTLYSACSYSSLLFMLFGLEYIHPYSIWMKKIVANTAHYAKKMLINRAKMVAALWHTANKRINSRYKYTCIRIASNICEHLTHLDLILSTIDEQPTKNHNNNNNSSKKSISKHAMRLFFLGTNYFYWIALMHNEERLTILWPNKMYLSNVSKEK